MKTCSKCSEEKPYEAFHLRACSKDGYHGHCKECRAKYGRRHYVDHKETYAEQMREYSEENREELLEYKRSYYQRKGREQALIKNYGLTEEKYNELYAAQDGCCAVCKKHGSTETRSLSVDHNHHTGEIRGLLCGMCNRKFIAHRNDPDIFEAAAAYLRQGTGLFVPEGKERPRRRRKRKSRGDK